MLYILLIIILTLFALLLTLFVAGSMYWAYEAKNRGFSVKTIQRKSQTSVISINQNYVTFIPGQTDLVDSKLPTVALVGNSGHIITNNFITQRKKEITRGIKSKVGEVVAKDKVAVDSFVYQHNPSQSLSLEYKEITYESELGPMTAWHIPAESKKWVVGVHGHRSNMRESLRLVPTFNSLGINVLLINYRNDPNQPEDPQKIHTFGIREWKDLESAVRYIKTYDPDDISLLGHSMGGGIIMKYLFESKNASEVSKVILESPTLDLNQIIVNQAEQLTFMPHMMLLSAKFFLSKMLNFTKDFLIRLSLIRKSFVNKSYKEILRKIQHFRKKQELFKHFRIWVFKIQFLDENIFFGSGFFLYRSEIFQRFQKSYLENHASKLKIRKIPNAKFFYKCC